MAENKKPVKGRMSSSNMIYYSSIMPEGSDIAKNMQENWNQTDHDLFQKVLSQNGTADDTWAAQKRLSELGYLEPHLVDGLRGQITDGAIRRYQYNTSGPGGVYAIEKAMDDAGDWLWKQIWGE
jgi:peptidoglycan hydrolase-like protein with peptidoglycan-binding domain